jgi:transcriptional regulator with XRE-family HTH domain
MTSTLKQFKRRALSRPEVRAAYEAAAGEFAFLDEVLRARAESGLTQAEVAERIGTTQSAIARLESAEPKHSPSIATLQKYAKALGYTVEVKLVKERRLTKRSSGPGKTVGRRGAKASARRGQRR